MPRYRYAAHDPKVALEARVEELVRNAVSELDIESLFAARRKLQANTLEQLTGLVE
jgi:regulator of protease activity HflC (stomatin/prohibitin superfamily)